MLNIILIGLVVIMVLNLYTCLALWGCFEEEEDEAHKKNEKEAEVGL